MSEMKTKIQEQNIKRNKTVQSDCNLPVARIKSSAWKYKHECFRYENSCAFPGILRSCGRALRKRKSQQFCHFRNEESFLAAKVKTHDF